MSNGKKGKVTMRICTVLLVCVACLLGSPGIAEARYVDGMNLYEYVRSGPVGLVDPGGLAVTAVIVVPDKDSLNVSLQETARKQRLNVWELNRTLNVLGEERFNKMAKANRVKVAGEPFHGSFGEFKDLVSREILTLRRTWERPKGTKIGIDYGQAGITYAGVATIVKEEHAKLKKSYDRVLVGWHGDVSSANPRVVGYVTTPDGKTHGNIDYKVAMLSIGPRVVPGACGGSERDGILERADAYEDGEHIGNYTAVYWDTMVIRPAKLTGLVITRRTFRCPCSIITVVTKAEPSSDAKVCLELVPMKGRIGTKFKHVIYEDNDVGLFKHMRSRLIVKMSAAKWQELHKKSRGKDKLSPPVYPKPKKR